MRDLVSERPNVVPVGIGNSGSEIDMSGYLNSATTSSDYEDPVSVGVSDEEGNGEAVASEGQDVTEPDEDNAKIHLPVKRKAAESSTNTPKPVVKQEPTGKKTRAVMEKFSDVARAQEETVQKSIDMKIERLELTKDTDIARIKAQERIQIERDRRKAELKSQKIRLEQDKMWLEYELRLAQLQAHRPTPFMSTSFTVATDHINHISGPSSSSSTSFSSPAHTSSHNLELGEEFHFGNVSIGQMEPLLPLYLPTDHPTDDQRDGHV
jgi:hypothetical protein